MIKVHQFITVTVLSLACALPMAHASRTCGSVLPTRGVLCKVRAAVPASKLLQAAGFGSLLLLSGCGDSDSNTVSGALFTDIRVAEGHAAYIYYKPTFALSSGGFAGVLRGPTYDGWNWRNRGAIFIDVRRTTQSEELQLKTRDGLEIPFRVHFVFKVKDSEESIRKLIEEFSDKWYERAVKEPARTVVRDAVRAHTLAELQVDTATLTNTIATEMKTRVLAEVPVELVSVEVGQVLDPPALREQIVEKLRVNQRLEQEAKELELAQSHARTIAAQAEGQRQSEAAMRAALTPEYLKYLELQALRELAQKPNATIVIWPSQIGAAGPALQLPIPQK